MMPSLTTSDIQRYNRHLLLKDVGGVGQRKLRGAKVGIVGAGGLSSPVIAYLAASGIGQLSVFDDDIVSLSNLQRQFIHRTQDVGVSKVASAERFIAELNDGVVVKAVHERITADNAQRLFAGHDVIIEGCDSFAARIIIADACEAQTIPLVTGALGQFDGGYSVIAPWMADDKGRVGARFCDLYPDAPAPDDIPNCEVAGVLSVLPGIVGTMMANEVIKLVSGYAPPALGKLVLYSTRSGETSIMRYGRRSI